MRVSKASSVLVVLLLTVPPMAAQEDAHDAVCATNMATGATISEDRFFCEPLESTFFIQFSQFLEGLEHLESLYPDYIEVRDIGESIQGRPIKFVEVTNELSPVPRDQKLQLGYSASIHANEPAGREGMLRLIEDLAAGIGPHGAELQPLLDWQIINVWFPNPDSWAQGDYFSADSIEAVHECDRGVLPLVGGPAVGQCQSFDRENAAGTDLNRQFPSPGLIHKDHNPATEPESQAVVKELRFSGDHSNLVAGVDLHGMISSPNMIRSIIPNQDYDFRRMVLVVDMLRTIEDRVDADPSFAEWAGMDALLAATADPAIAAADEQWDVTCVDADELRNDVPCPSTPSNTCVGAILASACAHPSNTHDKPFQWGARWDMIGYTDTGFTSDYLMLSPRSPTGGMGAIGTITEFAYSHSVPDNHFVPKITDMHVAGVRQIVRTQMDMVGRLDSPTLAGTGNVGFAWTDDWVSSDDDPLAYEAGQAFDLNDESTWFDFDQVPYRVNNLNFWKDLNDYSQDPIKPVDAAGFDPSILDDLESFVITNQALDGLSESAVASIRDWVEGGGHLLLTDSALRWFERAGFSGTGVTESNVYLGHSNVQDWDHALMDDVTWDARVTGEGPAIGLQVGNHYPQWTLTPGFVEDQGGDIVGTTGAGASLGRVPLGDGTVDFLGAALPIPDQTHGCEPVVDEETQEETYDCGSDHRYGLADYSVSAFTYWVVMNSLGGHVEWQAINTPFVPFYGFDPLYGGQDTDGDGLSDANDDDIDGDGIPNEEDANPYEADGEAKDTPVPALAVLAACIVGLAALARRRF